MAGRTYDAGNICARWRLYTRKPSALHAIDPMASGKLNQRFCTKTFSSEMGAGTYDSAEYDDKEEDHAEIVREA